MQVLKIFSTIAGIGALLISAALVVAGAAVFTVTNDSGYADLPNVQLASPGVGMVADHIDFSFDARGEGVTFTPSDLRVRGDLDSSKDVFVGVAPDAAVREYLSETGFLRTFGDRGELRLALEDGVALADPASEDFWVATNAGDSIDWSLPAGDYSVVVLNRDGSAGFDVAFDGSVRIPFLRPVGGMLLGSGMVAALVGIVLVYVGVRRQDPPTPPEHSTAIAAT